MCVRLPFHSLQNMLGMITVKFAFLVTADVLSCRVLLKNDGHLEMETNTQTDNADLSTPLPQQQQKIYIGYANTFLAACNRRFEGVKLSWEDTVCTIGSECESVTVSRQEWMTVPKKKWCEETVNNVDLSPEAPSPLSLPPPRSLFTSLLATSTDLVCQFLPVVVLIIQFIETDKSWINFMHLRIESLYLCSTFNHVHVFCLSCSKSTHLWGLCYRSGFFFFFRRKRQ